MRIGVSPTRTHQWHQREATSHNTQPKLDASQVRGRKSELGHSIVGGHLPLAGTVGAAARATRSTRSTRWASRATTRALTVRAVRSSTRVEDSRSTGSSVLEDASNSGVGVVLGIEG